MASRQAHGQPFVCEHSWLGGGGGEKALNSPVHVYVRTYVNLSLSIYILID